MTAGLNLEQTLTSWEEALQQALAACEANDWTTLTRLTRSSNSHFDRFRALLGASVAIGDSSFISQHRERVKQDVADLERLIASLQAQQKESQSKIQGRRRARQTAKSYHPSVPTGPQHFRLYARNSGKTNQEDAR